METKEPTGFLDRLIKNWKTTAAAVVPAIMLLAAKIGISFDFSDVSILLAAFYGVMLLFAKD